ncbi:MAG: cell division protein FtsZ [Deltaproteobacteria bacterium]|nr:cell division protein FtsZ [Deltaproteobacteria bacterium]
MHIEFGENDHQQAKIKVIGVGGGGGNAIANMIAEQMEGVEFIAINTDAQALDANSAPLKLQIGGTLTKGLGAGGIPDQGRKAALEDVNRLEEVLAGSDMIFVAAGMGGGTGTGAAPIVAQVARDVGALTVGVVTKPFRFEGRKRGRIGEEGMSHLSECVDTLISIPNERLLELDESLTMRDAFRFADKVLSNAVRGISDLITIRGDINVDFADVRTIMTNRGRALMGTGYGTGDRRSVEAAEMAINSPLLEDVAIDGAMGILINITGGPDLTMNEVSEAVSMIEDSAHEDAHIIFGFVTLDEPCEEVKITVIATGFNLEEEQEDMQGRSALHTMARSGYFQSRPNEVGSRNSSAAPPTARRSESPEQVQMPAGGRVSTVRHTARSESDLDIPAFIRKHSE